MADAVCVPLSRVPEFWPLIADYIKQAVDKVGSTDYETLRQDVLHSRALLWIAVGGMTTPAAAVTQVAIANGSKFCTIIACGGTDRARWLPLISQIEKYAAFEGCTKIQIIGRKGWQRVLPDYDAPFVVLEKALK